MKATTELGHGAACECANCQKLWGAPEVVTSNLESVMREYYRWWNSITREGDPSRRPNLSIDSFKAGWHAHSMAPEGGWKEERGVHETTAPHPDTVRLEWLLQHVSGKEWRRLGVLYGDGPNRTLLNDAMAASQVKSAGES